MQDNEIFATSLYKDGLKCIDIVEATDKVQVIVKMFETIETIWIDANCDSCFDDLNKTLKPEINEFYSRHGYLQECIQNFTNVYYKFKKLRRVLNYCIYILEAILHRSTF